MDRSRTEFQKHLEVMRAETIQLLSFSSPAKKTQMHYFKLKYGIGTNGKCLVIAVGKGGSRYGFADIPEIPYPERIISDGQHRHIGTHLI